MTLSTRPTTTRERDRALQRLRSITTGVAVLGTAATAGFGALAAVTWSGSTTGVDQAAAADPTANARLTGADEDADTLTGADAIPTPGPATAAPLQPNPTPLATTRKKARVTSGGSG